MTDKQIIFKCDVDCIRKNTEECFELDCIKGQESILKQLKRAEQTVGECHKYQAELEDKLTAKEQECERLKSAFVRAECQIADDEVLQCDIREAIEELKAENEELKRQHQGDKGLITSTGKMNYQLLQEYDKLKQILTEIKEIAEKGFKHSQCNCGAKADLDLILQKISECEGNND